MADSRKPVPPATVAALWTLSNGHCYAPGCTAPVVVEVRPGVYRKNAQVAHIHGVRAGRHVASMDWAQLNNFTNLLLLCLPHHSEVDDKKTGEKLYPPELLRRWKTKHEGSNGPALAQLGTVDEDALTELLASAFEPPIKRLEKIADQLERTGTLSASTVAELRQVIDVLVGGPDQRTAHLLMSAADMLSAHDLSATAQTLMSAADVLSSGGLPATARNLMITANALPDSATRLEAALVQMNNTLDLISSAASNLRHLGPM